jgi:hypothetical protein
MIHLRSFLRVLVCTSIVSAGLAIDRADGQEQAVEMKAVVLFDGTSMAAWGYHLVDPQVKLEDVWSVKDGVLVCKGEPLGYLQTRDDFKNFKLTLQWRWAPGKEPGNSGVLLRATGEPVGFMPKCVEAQLMHGSAGDIWAFFGFGVAGPPDRSREVKDHEALGNFNGVAAIKNAEKPPGEWNTYEIVLNGDQLSVTINGEKVNEATGCDQVAGKIGLQSEGGEIHFRDIKLVPLQ